MPIVNGVSFANMADKKCQYKKGKTLGHNSIQIETVGLHDAKTMLVVVQTSDAIIKFNLSHFFLIMWNEDVLFSTPYL